MAYRPSRIELLTEADEQGEPVDWESIADDLAEARAQIRDY